MVTTSSGPPHETSVRVQVNCQFAGGPIAGIVIGILMVYVLFCGGLLVGILCLHNVLTTIRNEAQVEMWE